MKAFIRSTDSPLPSAVDAPHTPTPASSRWYDWWAALTAALLAVGLVWAARALIIDDALIVFRVAENLARGQGFVYNLGERTLVTTTPLYTLSLVPTIWLLGTPFRASLVIHVAAAVGLSVAAYRLGLASGSRWVGVVAAVSLAFCPLLVMAFSMESYLYVALILASLWAYFAGRYPLAALLLGLTAVTRGDGVLLGVSVCGHYLLTRQRLRWTSVLIFGAVVVAWYGFATLYFGWPFPTTLSAKMAHGQINWLRVRFPQGLWLVLVDDYGLPWLFAIALPCIALGVAYAFRRDRRWLILAAYTVLYFAGYVWLGVPRAEWYYAPLAPGLVLLSALGGGTLVGAVRRATERLRDGSAGWSVISLVACVAVGVLLIAPQALASVRTIADGPDWKALVYPSIGRWIQDNTGPETTLAAIDIGHLGYYSQRRIIDMAGLVQPEVSSHLVQHDPGYAIRAYRPDLVLLWQNWLPEVQSADWFCQSYTPLREFRTADPGRPHIPKWVSEEPFLLFGRRTGVKVQPHSVVMGHSHEAHFAGGIDMLGYTLEPAQVRPGEAASLTVFWRCTQPVATAYSVFSHLISADQNRLWGGSDSQPQEGHYPTTAWKPGETIADRHDLPVNPATPPGQYLVEVGLYYLDTGERLKVLGEGGTASSDRILLLTPVDVSLNPSR